MAIVTLNTAQETALNWSAKGTERKIQNVMNIIRTYKGEVAYNRSLGISSEIIDKPIDEVRAIMAEDLASNIEQNVCHVRISALSVDVVTETGDISITVSIEV
jgi:hypothetical protein